MRASDHSGRVVVCVVLAALLACILVSAPPASGKPIKLRSCFEGAHELAESAVGWEPYESNHSIRPYRACPHELGLDVVEPVRNGVGALLVFDPGLRRVSHVRLTVAAGETVPGLAYEVVSCARGICIPLRRIEPRTADDREELITMPYDGEIGGLQIQATCEVFECLPGRGLRFNDVEFDIVDDDSPILGVSRTPERTWVQPDNVTLAIRALDRGVGFGRAAAYLDSRTNKVWAIDGCDQSAAPIVLLPLSMQCTIADEHSYTGLLDLRKATDGEHSVTLEAQDAAGNVSTPAVVKFKIDGTPPEAPADLRAGALNPDGWTRDDRTYIYWTNVAPVKDSETNAGLGAVFIDWQPRSGQADDPPARQGGIGGPDGDWGGPYTIPGDGLWDLYFWAEDAAGNPSSKIRIAVGRDDDAPLPPQLDAVPWLNRTALQIGRSLLGTQQLDADVEAGICGYSASFDATPDAMPPASINFRGSLNKVRLPSGMPEGDSFAHLRAISCSGVASTTASVGVHVDERPPIARSSDSGHIGWWNRLPEISISAADDRSGVAAIHRRIGSGPVVSTVGEQATVALDEGRYRLRFWATDLAGNVSDPDGRDIYVDFTPPGGRFAAIDSSRPGHIEASVADSLSGVDVAQIQYRRIDGDDDNWHGLPTAATADPSRESSLRLSTDIPDSHLADGVYALRVQTSDRAGNNAVFDATVGDEPLRLTLPLRERWSVSAGTIETAPATCVRKRRARRSRCVSARGREDVKTVRLVDASDSVTLAGDLRDAAGEPRLGVPLKIYATVKGAPAEWLADVVTSSEGHYTFKLPRGPSRRLTVMYEGDDRTLAVRANADLRVRAAASLTASTLAPKVGGRVIFSGRLASGDRWLPDVGKLIELQFKNGNIWQPGIGSVWALPSGHGRFRASYQFRSVRKKAARIKVRALIRHEGAWPFEDGVSNTVTITVRP